MLDEVYFFSELVNLYDELTNFSKSSNSNFKKIQKSLFALFYEFVFYFLRYHRVHFPSNYSRIIFILNNFNLTDDVKRKLLTIHSLLATRKKINIDKTILIEMIYLVADVFSFFFRKTKPEKLNPPKDINFTVYQALNDVDIILNENVDFSRIVVTYVDRNNYTLFCLNKASQIEIDCSNFWKEIPLVVNHGTILNCFRLKSMGDRKFSTTEESIIVIEPDYLYDITDISQCFTHKGPNAYLYFINKFFPKSTSYYTFLGYLVNQIFDYLLTEERTTFKDIFAKSVSKKILSYLVLKQKDKTFETNLKSELEKHFHNLQQIIPAFKNYQIQIEPTYFSAEYGITGRIDLLLEKKSEKSWKTIVELKSGNPPSTQTKIILSDGKKYSIGAWSSHYAQIIGYNLLLDSLFKERKGTSMILYSTDVKNPLRDAGNIPAFKRDFIKIRNWICLLEAQLGKGNFKIFNSIEKFSENDKYLTFQIQHYLSLFNSASEETRALLKEYIKFLINENRITRIGENGLESKASQACLWSIPFDEKNELDTNLTNLSLNLDKSNLANGYLCFERDISSTAICSLRKGDPVVLYHPQNINNPLSFQLLKAVIKEIEPDFVTVSLRNKFSDNDFFNTRQGWIIEQDLADTNFKYLFHSLFNFLLIPSEKIEFLLGLKEPIKNVNHLQNLSFPLYSNVIESAINSYPYFLIVGPPGTGKTRYVVKELIKYYLKNCEGKILVSAYTNRAVDEIVEILNKENLNHLFIRIGTKESSIYRQNLLPFLIEELKPEELEEKINSSKIILGTAHSFLSNPEIFDLNKFQVAIIDEASQLLFPHIAGILAYVDKFILIGDEKQLPPVILQEKFTTKVKCEILKKLNFDNLSMSYFEFLLRINRSKGWKNSYGILNKQSRMHPKVLEPINKFFYQGIIKTNPSRKSQDNISKIISFIIDRFKFDVQKRVFFIDCPRENKKKTNTKQADLITSVLNESYLRYDGYINAETFGIISPFRAQNFEIYSKLLPQLRKIVTIDTIERFQGSERDIILLSLPFNYLSEIYLSCNLIKTEDDKLIDRKLNVALTRAKELLLVFGNYALLSQSKYYSDFLKTFFSDSNTAKA